MSYNGIGLKSARGSGTSGHIQQNLASLGDKVKYEDFLQQDKKRKLQEVEDTKDPRSKELKEKLKEESRKELKDHNAKRVIEVKCMELRVRLEDEDLDDEEINIRVEELRAKLKKDRQVEIDKESHPKENIEDGSKVNDSYDGQKQQEKESLQGETGEIRQVYKYIPVNERRQRIYEETSK